jgi:hypothetical protein
MSTILEQERGIGVPQVVEPEMRQPGSPDSVTEGAAHRSGVKGLPLMITEHEALVCTGEDTVRVSYWANTRHGIRPVRFLLDFVTRH